MSTGALLGIAVAGIALLLALILRLRWHAFVALLVVSLAVGLAAGLPPERVLASMKTGMADTLGFIAVVVGLGAILGQLVESSGGAERLARALLGVTGERRAGWALGTAGLIVATPVFFDVALVILAPLAIALARTARRPVMVYALPLLAGLAIGHAFVPPTPGPLAVAEILKADVGWVICFGLLCGTPAMIVAGPLLARVGERWMPPPTEEPAIPAVAASPSAPLPPLALVLTVILLPLLLIVGNTVGTATLPEASRWRSVLVCVGHPFVALLATVLLAWYAFPTLRAGGRGALARLADKALEPAGIIILVTGAGGVFKQVLMDAGVGRALAAALHDAQVTPLVLGFALAAVMRLAQGSATVAMITAAGIVATLGGDGAPDPKRLALTVVAIASGASIASHVNDSGFWLVSRLFHQDETATLRTWTVSTTLLSLTAFATAVLLAALIT